MLLFALSLFFTDPAPQQMPRAEAYLVHEDGVWRLEDRYGQIELWQARSLIGDWIDDSGHWFSLSALAIRPPSADCQALLTRSEYAAQLMPMGRVRAVGGYPEDFRSAIALLAPCPIVDKPRAPRQLPHGYKSVGYWQHPTNTADIVCCFLPERTNVWFLASWHLAPEDDYPTRMEAFEDRFLREDFPSFVSCLRSSGGDLKTEGGRCERALLRRDAHHSIAAYPNWHFTAADEFAVLDDLSDRDFISSLTNDFRIMRAKYAQAIPTPLDGSNVLCVARIFADREEYLEALVTADATNMAWSAAYWSPERRELVAYLPEGGERDLLRTIRHEAFHQYLSYATSMIPTSPWLNEGYAQYFEDEEDDRSAETGWTEEDVERLSKLIPGLLFMDYDQFYDGRAADVRFKYLLAWSVIRFLEKGADEVRFKPFAEVKRKYAEALVKTRDMRKATSAAFGSEDNLKLFVAEWKKFWKNR